MGEDDYQPVPLLDEEHLSEKGAWRRRLSLEAFYQTKPARRVAEHWVWIGHAFLLTLSTTLFALAFCMRYARPSDMVVTTEFSTYCKHSYPMTTLGQNADLAQMQLPQHPSSSMTRSDTT